MTAAVVVGLVLLIAGVFAWSRLGSARSEKRSVDSYGHALGVLGDVARRGDRPAGVPEVSHDESGKAHVRTPDASGDSPPSKTPPAPPHDRPVISIPAPAEPLRFGETGPMEPVAPVVPVASVESLGLPPAGEAEEVEAEAGEAEEVEAGAPEGDGRQGDGERRGRLVLAAGGAAAAVVAVALVGWALASSPAHKSSAPPRHPLAPTSTTVAGSTTTTTVPKQLVPVSTSTTAVDFSLPASSYSLSFATTGTSPCWVGVESGPNGPWLWMTTVVPGQAATYQASGPTVVRLGAPTGMTVKVNGVPAKLPGYSLPYNVVFTPGSGPATA